MFHRIAVLATPPSSTLLALLLQLLLSLGVGEAKIEFVAIVISCDTVEFFDYSLRDFTILKAARN